MVLAGRNTWYKNEFEAEDVYKIWEKCCQEQFPNLLKKIEVKNIYFEYHEGGEFYGLDYIKKERLAEHLWLMENIPDDFLHQLNNNRVGTLETLDMLVEARDDTKMLATIWMCAFCLCMKENLPKEWCGKIYGAINRIEKILPKTNDKMEIYWRHGTKRHLPEILYSKYIYENLKINTLEDLIEMIALNCAYILEEYDIVNYYSVENRKIK